MLSRSLQLLALACLCSRLLSPQSHAASRKAELDKPIRFQGISDASAAIAVGSHFFITASDEECRLRIYNRQTGGDPIGAFNLISHLPLRGKSVELDLEGAAAIGNRLFWIGSHSRNRDGQRRVNREQFFAVDLTLTTTVPTLAFVGHADDSFFDELCQSKPGREHQLSQAAAQSSRSREGLNIEGMCATPEGKLWIGFRTPIPNDRALLIELENPQEVIAKKPARFGRSVTLDLNGLGIRDLVAQKAQIYILAGPHGGKDKASLYRWDGNSSTAKGLKLPGLSDIQPEAIAVFASEGPEALYVFTDSGNRSSAPKSPASAFFECYPIELKSKSPTPTPR